MTNYTFKQQSPNNYAVSNGTLTWNIQVDPNSGAWTLPSRATSGYNVMTEPRNGVCVATNQLNQFLRANPLYLRTKKINGATNKAIFEKNPKLRGI